MPRINGERLLADLRRIADFGRYQTGVHRPHLSPQDVESRHWLAGRMKEAGLEPVIDGVGTVLGSSPKTGPRILIGSHSDTQPRGGWLDGVMGVIYGLEVARALAEDPETAHLAVDVASWADEEGHWGQMIGSRSFVGLFGDADIDKARHRDEGTPMRDALKAAGLEGKPREHFEEGRYRGYLEAHIEQGGVLEATDKRIGIVTAIVGIYAYRLTFSGIQNHAGTTPMPIRKDAGVAMMRLYNEVMETFPEARRPAQRLDGRQDVGRARRAGDHSRQGRDDPAVPRRRQSRAGPLRERRCWRSSRRTTSAGRARSSASTSRAPCRR